MRFEKNLDEIGQGVKKILEQHGKILELQIEYAKTTIRIENMQNEIDGLKKSLYGLKGTNGIVGDVSSIKRSLLIIAGGATIISTIKSVFN